MKITSADYLTSATDLKGCPPPGPPEYAFIGRSNVGKSSLINLLTGKKALALTSATPGKTRLLNFFKINNRWHMVDLPGYGFARVSKVNRYDFNEAVANFIEQRPTLRHVFVLIDSRIEPQQLDLDFTAWLATCRVAFSLVFTKADKQSKTRNEASIALFKRTALDATARATGFYATSSVTKDGRSPLLAFINEDLVAAKKETPLV